MKDTDLPAFFPIPFAATAAGIYIRPIPEASQIGIQDGAASLTDGFPPDTFLPVGAGGVPPFGADFNGLLNQITLWNQWQGAGAPAFYDVTFSAAIGGYPKGATLKKAVGVGFWVSAVDDNATNPDSGGAGWILLNGPTTVVTASGAFTILPAYSAIGIARTSAVAVSSTTLLTAAQGAWDGQTVTIEDLIGNFNAFPVTVNAGSGQNISGLSQAVLNLDGQSAVFRFYASVNTWSFKP